MTVFHQAPARATVRAAFDALAPLFCYPAERFADTLEPAWRAARLVDVEASDMLERFAMYAAVAVPPELQLVYTSTFDLAPSCSPYLGEHLFAHEPPRRARLMMGLRASYRKLGFDELPELPDHVSHVIRYASRCGDDEWAELGAMILVPGLAAMDRILRGSDNPYRHLIAAAHRLSAAAFGTGGEA